MIKQEYKKYRVIKETKGEKPCSYATYWSKTIDWYSQAEILKMDIKHGWDRWSIYYLNNNLWELVKQ